MPRPPPTRFRRSDAAGRSAARRGWPTRPQTLARGVNPRHALRSYRRAHRFIDKYDALGRRKALAKPPNPPQRAIREAAVTDPDIARRLAMFSMWAAEPSVLLNPKVMVRALVGTRVRRPRGERPATLAGRPAAGALDDRIGS